MTNKTISVYGGTGFIGSNFCNYYKDVYVQPKDDYIPETNNLLYLISTVDNYNVYTSVYQDVYVNLFLLMRCLDHAKRKFGNEFVFTFISSWFVYGDTNGKIAKETDIPNPAGFYSITKECAERLLISYCKTFDIRYRILRMASILGIDDKKASPKKNAIQYLIKEISQGRPVKIYNTSSIRDLMDVRDCVRAIALVMEKGEEDSIYNVGNGIPVSVKPWLYRAADFAETPKENITEIPVPEFHSLVQTNNFQMDCSKLASLGYLQEYTAHDIVRNLVEYYKQTPE